MTDTPKRVLTFEQWSTINRALCGARLELANPKATNESTKVERRFAVSEALDALNNFEEIA